MQHSLILFLFFNFNNEIVLTNSRSRRGIQFHRNSTRNKAFTISLMRNPIKSISYSRISFENCLEEYSAKIFIGQERLRELLALSLCRISAAAEIERAKTMDRVGEKWVRKLLAGS